MGSRLAPRLGASLIDPDVEIKRHLGSTIHAYVEPQGEPAFLDLLSFP